MLERFKLLYRTSSIDRLVKVNLHALFVGCQGVHNLEGILILISDWSTLKQNWGDWGLLQEPLKDFEVPLLLPLI